MGDPTRLFDAFDRGTISRRQLFQALGLAAASVPLVPLARAFGQGQCAGRERDTSAACNKTPFKAPFEPTGWKTVLLDHFNMKVTEPEQEAAFYAAFLGWKVRSNDGKRDLHGHRRLGRREDSRRLHAAGRRWPWRARRRWRWGRRCGWRWSSPSG